MGHVLEGYLGQRFCIDKTILLRISNVGRNRKHGRRSFVRMG